MNYPTFEDFLQSKHAENYHGTDDNMPDAFDDWMGELDVQDALDYAEEYGKALFETYNPKKIAVQHLLSDYPKQVFPPIEKKVERYMEWFADQQAKHGEERASANDY